MPEAHNLTPADPSELATALAFALRYQGRKRVHNADEIMAEIVAKRLVEDLERAGFVVMKRPPEIGAAALGRVSASSPIANGSNRPFADCQLGDPNGRTIVRRGHSVDAMSGSS
jgi:hypothetical protein